MSEATEREADAGGVNSRLAVLALSGVSALGALAAMVASLPIVAGLLALPALGVAGFALMRSVLLCLSLVVFFQHNDIFLSLIGVPQLNKLLGAVALLAVALSLTHRDFRQTLAAGFLPLVCWLGVFITYGASILIAQDPSLAFQTTERLLSMGILTLLFAFGVKSLNDLRVILNVFLLSMALSAGVTIIDYVAGEQMFSPELRGDDGVATWEGTVRSTGTTLESVPMSATLLLGGVMLAFVFAFRSPRNRWLYGALAAFGAAAILLSLTRSATLSLGLAALFMLWRLRAHPQFGKALGGLLLSAVLVAALTPASVWSKFGALSDTSNDSTVQRRASYQVIGADLIMHNPLLGVGAGNYIVHYASDEYRFVPGRSEEPRPLHNVYLQVAAESGIAGFIFFVAMLWSTSRILFDLARSGNETIRLYAEALLFAFLAMAVQFVFLSSTSVLYFWVIIGLAIALRRIAAHDRV